MNSPQFEGVAISYDEDEDGSIVYQAHIFLADRVIQLDPYPTQEAATKSAEDFLEIMRKIYPDVST